MANDEKESGAEVAALVGALREDIAKLTEAVGHLFAAKGAEAGAAAREGLEEVLSRGRSAAERVRGRAHGAAESVEHTIEERPLASVLIALAVGFVLGTLARR